MSDELTVMSQENEAWKVEQALVRGDLAKLTEPQRIEYYQKVCQSTGLNPLTRPFDYITLNNKLTLYARKDATDQLRKLNEVSITDLKEEVREGVYIVTATAKATSGRSDVSKGAVNIAGLKGDALANAIMKAETKAKRRVTLSICGLGFLDETEIETIPPSPDNGRPQISNGQRELPANPQTPPPQNQPQTQPGCLSQKDLEWIGQQLKGKGDYARELLAAFGYTGYSQIPVRLANLLSLCIIHQVKPDWLLDTMMSGLKAKDLHDSDIEVVVKGLKDRFEKKAAS